jgi:hypothetical protein
MAGCGRLSLGVAPDAGRVTGWKPVLPRTGSPAFRAGLSASEGADLTVGQVRLLKNSESGADRSTIFPGAKETVSILSSDQNRSTNSLTLGPSPGGRGNCEPAPAQLPLPLGEGWGEGGNVTQ